MEQFLQPTLETEKKPDSILEITQQAISQANTIEILPENRNDKGELLAPNGEVSNLQNELHWKIIRTPAFKEWFGKSDIVDENGEPAMVYHYTHADLNQFDTFSREKGRSSKAAFYLTSGNYGQKSFGGNKIGAFVNAKIKELSSRADISGFREEDRKKLEREGYTGAAHFFENSEEYISNLKDEYRKKISPKSFTDKIYFGFNKIKEAFGGQARDGATLLQEIKKESQHLNSVSRDTSSNFYELIVFESSQIMIVNKEERVR